MSDLHGERFLHFVDNFFDQFPFGSSRRALTGPSGEEVVRYRPRSNLVEHQDGWYISCDMPGVDKSTISIDMSPDNVLTIKAESSREEQREGDHYHWHERHARSFSRSVRLPVNVNKEGITAKLENGVLRVHVPKSEAVPGHITVQVE
eukprot:gnl/Dysnectes_brevis/5932_a8831_411.p1 GENE.gnl/Dysnectes_brevis/5932_a8831_411~~gnl/Dysnectes_brevis/5932_a8831_411.p1  ORF type:complete len:148 (+),score=54.26 gnl/Dysnectes_brevis/5932_a8831_411:679-1122(+)